MSSWIDSMFATNLNGTGRQISLLTGVDLPLGGTGRPDSVGLYYAKIGIGTPSKDYYLQVGTDMMWVNCIQCKECPTRSNLGVCILLLFLISSFIYLL
ncbi:hypothetical protein P8452_01296 [Trifolium repens]|nr:hypothetical protein P8452_01296 [Trifolium repens]